MADQLAGDMADFSGALDVSATVNVIIASSFEMVTSAYPLVLVSGQTSTAKSKREATGRVTETLTYKIGCFYQGVQVEIIDRQMRRFTEVIKTILKGIPRLGLSSGVAGSGVGDVNYQSFLDGREGDFLKGTHFEFIVDTFSS